jgi:hypothetical protein
MKTKIFYLLLFAVFIFQNCQDSTENPSLDQRALKSTLATSTAFSDLVDLHVIFLDEGRKQYLALSKDERDELKAIMDRGGSVEELEKASGFAKLSTESSAKLPLAYNMLIKQLDAKYSYDVSDLRELIIAEVAAKRVATNSNGRTAQISCQTKCANGAEAYYWYMYDGCQAQTGQAGTCSDTAAAHAQSYYNGCMDGCGGTNPS